MSKQEKFFDVYVSYPPNTDRERIHACLYDNLPENEVESLIQALAERPQAIVAEKCTQDERENAQHYFSYLGLDVIVRQAMELEAVEEEPVLAVNTPDPIQCPVCMTIIDELDAQECKTCHFDLTEKNELAIQRKRIEWQEKSLSSIKNKPKLPTSSNMNASRKRKSCARKSVLNWNPNYAKS